MELPVSSDCGVYPSTDKIIIKDGSPGETMASSSHDVAPQQPACFYFVHDKLSSRNSCQLAGVQ